MVAGFIEQQNGQAAVHQRLRQGNPFFGAARQGAQHRIRVQVQTVQGFSHPLFPVPAVQCLDLALHCIEVAMTLGVLVY